MTARDELAEIIWDEDACDWRQFGPNDLADAILAAGYRKPRTITTLGDLAGLPEGTVIRTAHGKTMELFAGYWSAPDSLVWWSPIIDWLPATVLYEPEANE